MEGINELIGFIGRKLIMFDFGTKSKMIVILDSLGFLVVFAALVRERLSSSIMIPRGRMLQPL